MQKYFLEALEGFHEYIEIIRIGNITDLTNSYLDMLDIDFGSVGMGAYFLMVIENDEFGIDYIWLCMPPIEGFQVVVVFLLVGPDEIIFVDLFTCLLIAKGTEYSIFFRV